MSTYHYRRGPFFWALILIAVGIIFLVQNFNPTLHPWYLLARYWPVLIIIWGLSKLLDYVYARMHPEITAPPLFSGSEVVILILVLILGTLFSRVVIGPWSGWRQDWGAHWNVSGWNNPFLRSYTYTDNLTQPVSGKATLVVSGRRGDIVIQGSKAATVSAAVKETIRAPNEQDALKAHNQLKLAIVSTAGRDVIEPDFSAVDDQGRNMRLDWTIQVPRTTSTEITARQGDILISGLTGSQSLTSGSGEVHASDLSGPVQVEKSGGSASIQRISGTVDVHGRGGDVGVADVSGAVTVLGDFTGSVRFANLAQGVHFKSSRTDLTVGKLSGALNLEMGSLEASGVDGALSITTRQKDISVRGFKQSVELTDRNGNIALHAAAPPTHPIEVNAKNGDIVLALPAGSHFTLDASSEHGEVSSDFAGPDLVVNASAAAPSIKGTMGKGGPEIRLSTTYGAIHLVRESPAPATSAPANGSLARLRRPGLRTVARHSRFPRTDSPYRSQ